MNVKKLTTMAMLTAISMIVFLIEAQIPLPIAIPGVKLGVANVITLFAIWTLGRREAGVILLIRIVLGNLIVGSVMAMLYSLAGGLLSGAVMIALKKCGRFSDMTKSWSGQPDHGQIRGGNNDEKEIIKRSYGICNGTFPRSMRRSKDRDDSSRDNCREKRGDNNSRYDSCGDGRSSRRHTDRRLRSGFPANGICWRQRRIHRL